MYVFTILIGKIQQKSQSYEQEEYIAKRGHREPEQVETGTIAAIEWTWKLKSERLLNTRASK